MWKSAKTNLKIKQKKIYIHNLKPKNMETQTTPETIQSYLFGKYWIHIKEDYTIEITEIPSDNNQTPSE